MFVLLRVFVEIQFAFFRWVCHLKFEDKFGRNEECTTIICEVTYIIDEYPTAKCSGVYTECKRFISLLSCEGLPIESLFDTGGRCIVYNLWIICSLFLEWFRWCWRIWEKRGFIWRRIHVFQWCPWFKNELWMPFNFLPQFIWSADICFWRSMFWSGWDMMKSGSIFNLLLFKETTRLGMNNSFHIDIWGKVEFFGKWL